MLWSPKQVFSGVQNFPYWLMMPILVVYLTFVSFSVGKKLCSFRRNGKNISRWIMSLVNLSKQMVIYFSHKNWKMGLYSLKILCLLNSLKGLLSLYLLKDSKTKLQNKNKNIDLTLPGRAKSICISLWSPLLFLSFKHIFKFGVAFTI